MTCLHCGATAESSHTVVDHLKFNGQAFVYRGQVLMLCTSCMAIFAAYFVQVLAKKGVEVKSQGHNLICDEELPRAYAHTIERLGGDLKTAIAFVFGTFPEPKCKQCGTTEGTSALRIGTTAEDAVVIQDHELGRPLFLCPVHAGELIEHLSQTLARQDDENPN